MKYKTATSSNFPRTTSTTTTKTTSRTSATCTATTSTSSTPAVAYAGFLRSGRKETIIDTRTEKEQQLDSDWETEQEQ